MAFLGDTSQGADAFPGSGNRALVQKVTATEDGTISGAQAYFDSTSLAGANAKFIVYANGGSAPDTLVTASNPSAIPAGGGLVTFNGLSGSLTNGTSYYIGIVWDGGGWQTQLSRETAVAVDTQLSDSVTYSSPPTWPGSGATYTTIQINAALEYTTGGGPASVMPVFLQAYRRRR